MDLISKSILRSSATYILNMFGTAAGSEWLLVYTVRTVFDDCDNDRNTIFREVNGTVICKHSRDKSNLLKIHINTYITGETTLFPPNPIKNTIFLVCGLLIVKHSLPLYVFFFFFFLYTTMTSRVLKP